MDRKKRSHNLLIRIADRNKVGYTVRWRIYTAQVQVHLLREQSAESARREKKFPDKRFPFALEFVEYIHIQRRKTEFVKRPTKQHVIRNQIVRRCPMISMISICNQQRDRSSPLRNSDVTRVSVITLRVSWRELWRGKVNLPFISGKAGAAEGRGASTRVRLFISATFLFRQ